MKNILLLKRLVFFPMVFIILFLSGLPGHTTAGKQRKQYHDPRDFARAHVDKIEYIQGKKGPGDKEIRIHLTVIDGKRKGEIHFYSLKGDDDHPKDLFYREGNTVFIGISKVQGADADEYISIYDVDNTAGIIVLLSLLLLTIIAVGRFKGLMSMLSLVATIILIFYILIPMTLKGHSPLPIAVAISLFAIIVTIPIIAGFKIKTIAAMGGAAAGVIFATILSLFSGWLMHLSGIVTNEMLTVFYASAVEVNLHGLAMAGMVIAALGAIMDVCISIASATEEIFEVNPEIPFQKAFTSIFTVSSDMLGATVNTLLFAYVGSSLPLVLLIAMRLEPNVPMSLILNYNPVLSELVKSAVGCIGMFLSMPATAIISIELQKKKRLKRAG